MAVKLDELLSVDLAAWRDEVPRIEEHYAGYGERVPKALHAELAALRERLEDA